MRTAVFLCAMGVLFFARHSGTLSCLFDITAPISNTVTPAVSDITVTEDFDGKVKRNVTAENTGTHDIYVRGAYVAYYVSDADGTVLPTVPSLYGVFGSDWKQMPDGYWYYNKSLAPAESASVFIVEMYADEVQGAHLVIDILMEGVQSRGRDSDGTTPALDIWGVSPDAFVKK